MPDDAPRYMRARGLVAVAVETLATHRGGIRDRFRLVDPEVFTLRPDDLPDRDGIRELHSELRQLFGRVTPRVGEGTIPATIRAVQLSTLEMATELLWRLHAALTRA